MRRSERPNRKADYEKVQTKLQEQVETNTSTPLVSAVNGGSINNLPVKTEAFHTWLAAKQEHNVFIGKHVTAAPEYNTDSKEASPAETTTISMQQYDEMLTESNRSYDPNAKDSPLVDDDDPTKSTNEAETKFIDLVIVENATRKLLLKSDDEIVDHAINQIRQYRQDDEYTPVIDVQKAVTDAKPRLLLIMAQEKEKNLLLKQSIF